MDGLSNGWMNEKTSKMEKMDERMDAWMDG